MSKLFMSEDKIRELLSLARSNQRDYALLHTAFSTGLRVSDLVNLKRSDIEVSGRISKKIKIKMIKTGRSVERSLTDPCRAAIKNYLLTRMDLVPFLFISEADNRLSTGGPLNRSSVHRIIKGYLGELYREEEVRENACHVTRRSMAQIISQKTGRIESASVFLGHSNVASTMKYLDCGKFKEAADCAISSMSWD